MPHNENNNFSAPMEEHSFSALLFDMDGTIIDSTAAIVKYWHRVGKEIGVDPETILRTSHGRRSIDVLGLLAPKLANWDFVCAAERKVPLEFGGDAVEIPGARRLLEQLEAVRAPWALVTSGTSPLVTGWLDVMKLAHPRTMVTAEQVARGKPDPLPYLEGARRLGKQDIDPARVVVFEDAPAGVMSGKAAGYRVVALATSHGVDRLQEAGADWIVEDMRSVTMSAFDAKTGTTSIQISNALVA